MFAKRAVPVSSLDAPCAPWEIPVERDLAELGGGPARSFRPSSARFLPVDAAEDLADLVGPPRPGDLLVLPSATRPAADGLVCVPDQVVGMGPRGVAQWVDDLPYPRVVGVIPYAELVAAEHLLEGEHGCLVLTGARTQLTIHYRSPAWPAVGDLLTRLRAHALASTGASTMSATGEHVQWEELPYSLLVGLGDPRPPRCLSAAAESVRGRWWRHRRTRPAAQVVLTRYELVVLRHVTGRAPLRHGVNLLAVAREHVTGLAASGERLTVRTPAGAHQIELNPALAEAAQTKFRPMLRACGARGSAAGRRRAVPRPRTAPQS